MFKQYKAFFDNAYDGFTVIDLSLPFGIAKHLNVNQQFCDMLGYNKKELLSSPASDFIHPNYKETVRTHMLGHRDGTKNHSFLKWTWIRKDGTEIGVESKIYSEETDNYHVAFGVHRDVTEKNYLETTIKEQLAKEAALRKELEAQATEKSKDNSAISHELL